MTTTIKKHSFLLPFARLYTRADGEAYDQICFREAESFGDEDAPALTAPESWSNEAVATLQEAACRSAAADLRAIEENTVPSWLWRHQACGARRAAEGDVRQIIDRVVGAAAATAWKEKLFSSEKHARAFNDEARFALMQRHIAFAPDVLRNLGLGWAYGLANENSPATKNTATPAAQISNAEIDVLLGKAKNQPAALWKKLFSLHGQEQASVALRLNDIAADWGSATHNPARAAIDLMALRHNDGGLNIDALRQTTRIAVILLDLSGRPDVTLSVANLAPLLMALGLAYDSEAGRALAASTLALITAECMATSAELAALRGISPAFDANRDHVMRSLRNHRRAAYGDDNDYEKLSVLPVSLPLKNCPDLALTAEAQRRWDEALAMAQAFGLRSTHATDLTPSLTLAILMGSATQGLEPMANLTELHPDNETFRTDLHPAVGEALTRLNYPRGISSLITQHIAGSRSLHKSHGITASALRNAGLGNEEIAKIEAYIPQVNNLRLAITPWIVGVAFCRDALKIPMRSLENMAFDLIKHLGFDAEDLAAANAACYGHGTVRNAKALHIRHRPLFACGNEVNADARIRMAAATQSFVSGDTGITVPLPTTDSIASGAEVTLAAWRCGLKSLVLAFDPTVAARPVRTATTMVRRIKAATQPHAKPISAAGKHVAQGKKPPAPRTAKGSVEKRLRGN